VIACVVIVYDVAMHRAVGVHMGRNVRSGVGRMWMCKAMVIVARRRFRSRDERSLERKRDRGRRHDDGGKTVKWALHIEAQSGTSTPGRERTTATVHRIRGARRYPSMAIDGIHQSAADYGRERVHLEPAYDRDRGRSLVQIGARSAP
jgi:hypothetical protein